jgi:hypothetical protein
MKTKISFLIATGLIFALSSKAQYGAACPENRVVIQGRLFIPAPPAVTIQYSKSAPVRYDDYRDRRYRDNDRYDGRCDRKEADYGRYDAHSDWREAQYERYCREQQGYRMSREEFYRKHRDYRGVPIKANEVVVYGN